MRKKLTLALIGVLALTALAGCTKKDETVNVPATEVVEDVATEESVEVPEMEEPEVEVPEVEEPVESTSEVEKTDLSDYEAVPLPEIKEEDGVTYYYDNDDESEVDWDAFFEEGAQENGSVLDYQNLPDKEFPSGITMADIESGKVTDEMLLYLVEYGVTDYMAQYGADHDYTVGEFFGDEVCNYFSEIYPYEEMDVVRKTYGEFEDLFDVGHKIQPDDTLDEINRELISLSMYKLFN